MRGCVLAPCSGRWEFADVRPLRRGCRSGAVGPWSLLFLRFRLRVGRVEARGGSICGRHGPAELAVRMAFHEAEAKLEAKREAK